MESNKRIIWLKIWEIANVSISDVIQVLDVDDYILLDNIFIQPKIFRVMTTILFVVCCVWSLVGNIRTIMVIITQK